jgi:UPF0288 family protein (methanogenesis marker protein 3)
MGLPANTKSVAKVESSIVFSNPTTDLDTDLEEDSQLVGSVNIELDPHIPKIG